MVTIEADGNVVQKGNQEFRGRVEFTKNPATV